MNESQQSLWSFMMQQSGKLLEQTLAHIGLTFISLLLSIIIGIPARYLDQPVKKGGVALF